MRAADIGRLKGTGPEQIEELRYNRHIAKVSFRLLKAATIVLSASKIYTQYKFKYFQVSHENNISDA